MLILALLLFGCRKDPEAIPGTQIRMDFARADGFYASPFPSDDRRLADGTVDVSGFPDPLSKPFAGAVLGIAANGGLDGFGETSGIFFTTDAPLQADGLPDVFADDAPIFLLSVDADDPGYLARAPIDAAFAEDGGPYGADDLLSILPLQGAPLRPGTTYAAVVMRALGDADGEPLGVSLPMAQLAAGEDPDDLPESARPAYRDAVASLEEAGIDPEEIAGLTVFTTRDPRTRLEALRDDLRARGPTPGPFVKTEEFPSYCVYRSTMVIPVYQEGEPPYLDEGGGIRFEGGVPVYQHDEEAAVWVTIPRAPAPAGGWPVVSMIPTGGGGDRPLVDRGIRPEPGGEPLIPGEGPALHFAAAGWAGISVDGPHGGLRNVSGGDQQFLLFNVTNPVAMLDNLRQSAAEAAILPDVLAGLTLDTSDCPGASGSSRFDLDHLALFGHSMGATIAPTAAALAPEYEAILLSGAGGSWIGNVVYKLHPIEVRPVAEAMIGYTTTGHTLTEHDPLLSMVQLVGEDVDPPVHARALTGEIAEPPRHVLMMQGIVDSYILPPMANALSLSLKLDLAGPALDEADPRLDAFRTFGELAPVVGAGTAALPVSGNRGSYTQIVTQHAEDGIEDGHEAVFQTEAPKHEIRCFLSSLLVGTPRVPAAGAIDAPCE